MPLVPCPACSNDNSRKEVSLKFQQLPSLSVRHCRTCSHRWLPTTADIQSRIEKKYASHYTGFRVDAFFVRRITDELRHRLGPAMGKAGKILDVGCGNGEFIQAAQQEGHECVGIDVSKAAVELCTRKGFDAVEGDFLSHSFAKKFDLITLWDVMEHLRHPRRFAERAASLISTTGSLVLKIPSPGTLNFQLLRAFPARGGTLLGAPGHVQYFTEGSLSELLALAGFKHLLWFDSERFRMPDRTTNPRKYLARGLKSVIGRAAKNRTLYVFASKQSYSLEVLARVAPRRVEAL